MKTIKNQVINEFVINKSKFICILKYVETKEEINNILASYKKIYKDATHYCYAYILSNTEKCFDDGEPSGTAGKPILNILSNNDLSNVLCLVIRYFGGIKLGAGGLVRAYSNSANEAVKKAEICYLTKGYNITITFDYEITKIIDNLALNVLNKCFTNKITYNFNISHNDYLNKKNIIDKYTTSKKDILIKISK